MVASDRNHKRPTPYGRGLMKKGFDSGLPVGTSKVDTPWFRMHPVLTNIKWNYLFSTFSSCMDMKASGAWACFTVVDVCIFPPSEAIWDALEVPVIAVVELFSLFVSVGVPGLPLKIKLICLREIGFTLQILIWNLINMLLRAGYNPQTLTTGVQHHHVVGAAILCKPYCVNKRAFIRH